ncbi:hypothetical protein WMF30_26655 [Sorangium sp. So ce134]
MSTTPICRAGNPRLPTKHVDHASTERLCKTCRHTVDAKIRSSREAVHFDKFCREHGRQRVPVAFGIAWYLDALLHSEERALALEERFPIGEGVDRIAKGCIHDAPPEGRLMPGCAYNDVCCDNAPRSTAPAASSKISRPPARRRALRANVLGAGAARAMMRAIDEAWGGIDVLANDAGTLSQSRPRRSPPATRALRLALEDTDVTGRMMRIDGGR